MSVGTCGPCAMPVDTWNRIRWRCVWFAPAWGGRGTRLTTTSECIVHSARIGRNVDARSEARFSWVRPCVCFASIDALRALALARVAKYRYGSSRRNSSCGSSRWTYISENEWLIGGHTCEHISIIVISTAIGATTTCQSDKFPTWIREFQERSTTITKTCTCNKNWLSNKYEWMIKKYFENSIRSTAH